MIKIIGAVLLLAMLLVIIIMFLSGSGLPINTGTSPIINGVSNVRGEDDLTPVGTFTTLNAGVGLEGVGSADTFTLNVITPTPQPAAEILVMSLPVPDGSTSSNTAYVGVPGKVIYGGAGAFVVANDLYYEPFQVTETITVNRMSFEVTSAGNPGDGCRIGIYESDGDWQAVDLVTDAGQVANDSTGWKHATVNVALSPGIYLAALVCNTGPALYSHHTAGYVQGTIDTGTTSSTRNVIHRRDSSPTGTPYSSGFADPGDSPWDTQDLINNGSEASFVILRWSV